MRNYLHCILLFSLLAGVVSNTYCQTIPQLEQKLEATSGYTRERVDVLNLLSRSYAFIDSRKALNYAKEALNISGDIKYEKGIAYAYRNMSAVYSYLEIFFLSVEYLQRSLELFEQMGDMEGMGNCYISYGHTYRRLQQRDKEIEFHKKSYDIFLKLGDAERIGVTAHNLGESYLNNNQDDLSRSMTLRSIQINDSLKNQPVLSSCYKVMGILEYRAANYSSAKEYFERVFAISDQLGQYAQKLATAESHIYMAKIFKAQGLSHKELEQWQKAVDYCRKHELTNLIETVYAELISFHAGNKNSDKSLSYLNEYRVVLDSIENKQLRDRLEMINNVIDMHKLETTNQRLEQESIIQQERITYRNILIIISVISGLSLLVFLFLLRRANGQLRKSLVVINEQRLTLEEMNKTKDKFFGIIAHDLRSPLNSLKAFSSLLINQLDKLSPNEIALMSKDLQSSVDATIKLTDNLISWAKIQMRDVETKIEVIPVLGLLQEVARLYERAAEQKKISLVVEADHTLTILADRNQIILVIRNLVNNAIKFTDTNGKVILSAKKSDQVVEIVISDNGVGMSEDMLNNVLSISNKRSQRGTQGEKGTGLGLVLCNEFVLNNKGKLTISSKLGEGTTIVISLPVS